MKKTQTSSSSSSGKLESADLDECPVEYRMSQPEMEEFSRLMAASLKAGNFGFPEESRQVVSEHLTEAVRMLNSELSAGLDLPKISSEREQIQQNMSEEDLAHEAAVQAKAKAAFGPDVEVWLASTSGVDGLTQPEVNVEKNTQTASNKKENATETASASASSSASAKGKAVESGKKNASSKRDSLQKTGSGGKKKVTERKVFNRSRKPLKVSEARSGSFGENVVYHLKPSTHLKEAEKSNTYLQQNGIDIFRGHTRWVDKGPLFEPTKPLPVNRDSWDSLFKHPKSLLPSLGVTVPACTLRELTAPIYLTAVAYPILWWVGRFILGAKEPRNDVSFESICMTMEGLSPHQECVLLENQFSVRIVSAWHSGYDYDNIEVVHSSYIYDLEAVSLELSLGLMSEEIEEYLDSSEAFSELQIRCMERCIQNICRRYECLYCNERATRAIYAYSVSPPSDRVVMAGPCLPCCNNDECVDLTLRLRDTLIVQLVDPWQEGGVLDKVGCTHWRVVDFESTEKLIARCEERLGVTEEDRRYNKKKRLATRSVNKMRCAYCRRPGKFSRCARCHKEAYCSVSCQKLAWICHRQFCGNMSQYPLDTMTPWNLCGLPALHEHAMRVFSNASSEEVDLSESIKAVEGMTFGMKAGFDVVKFTKNFDRFPLEAHGSVENVRGRARPLSVHGIDNFMDPITRYLEVYPFSYPLTPLLQGPRDPPPQFAKLVCSTRPLPEDFDTYGHTSEDGTFRATSSLSLKLTFNFIDMATLPFTRNYISERGRRGEKPRRVGEEKRDWEVHPNMWVVTEVAIFLGQLHHATHVQTNFDRSPVRLQYSDGDDEQFTILVPAAKK